MCDTVVRLTRWLTHGQALMIVLYMQTYLRCSVIRHVDTVLAQSYCLNCTPLPVIRFGDLIRFGSYLD